MIWPSKIGEYRSEKGNGYILEVINVILFRYDRDVFALVYIAYGRGYGADYHIRRR